MIREFFTYLTHYSRFKKAATFGHLSQVISLIGRQKRCKKYWSSHLKHCHQTILEVAHSLKDTQHLLVLGSGPVHEIPLNELSFLFEKITLVDIVHLDEIKFKYRHLKNVHFVSHDISEIEEAVKKEKKLLSHLPQAFLNETYSLVISANLMGQIPLHFEEYIQKHLPNVFAAQEVETFLENLAKNHFNYLKQFKARVLLYTDTETYFYNKQNQILQTDCNYSFLSLPPPLKEWMWEIAPIPEFTKEIGIRMKVQSFIIK